MHSLSFLADFCPDGYEQVGADSCYKFVSTPATWDDARYDCLGDDPDGELVVINDAAENDYIKGRIAGRAEEWWIGRSNY